MVAVAGEQPRWIIVGLGNPPVRGGPLRVNAGVLVLEAIAGGASFRRVGIAEVCDTRILDVDIALVKFGVFMERAGPAVVQHLQDARIPPWNLIVLHDDDEVLEVGSIRIRTRGPAGKHRGMSSVLRAMGGDPLVPIKRIRIGTGLPPLASRRADLAPQEVERLRVVARGVARAVHLLAHDREDAAMSLYNRRDRAIDTVPGLVRTLEPFPSRPMAVSA